MVHRNHEEANLPAAPALRADLLNPGIHS